MIMLIPNIDLELWLSESREFESDSRNLCVDIKKKKKIQKLTYPRKILIGLRFWYILDSYFLIKFISNQPN